MRLFLATAACLIAAGTASAELIAFYPFDGGAADVTGNGNDGVISGASFTTDGFEGGAFEFDGTNDFIELPIDINPATLPQVTFGAWANTDLTNAIRAIVSHDSGGFDRNINLDFRGAGAGFRYSAFTGSGVVSAGLDPAPVGDWVFVAARYDASAGTVTLDVDDDRVTVPSFNGGGFSTTRVGSNPGFGEFFDGRIDNVFFFDEVLSDSRIDQIRLQGASAIIPEPCTGLLMLVSAGAWYSNRKTRHR